MKEFFERKDLLPAAKNLEVYFIDVEGGQATLFVSPSGESMLVDTGWAGFNSGHGLPPDRFKELLLECARNDIRAVAIAGGGGLGVLDFYEEIDKRIPLKGRRWVVSHVNVISPRDIERIARMGLVLTTHTNAYLYKALETTASRLKPEQYDDIVPMNALREAGVTVSVATDNVPISLWYPVAQTVARKDFKTKRTFGEKQALSRMNALRAATA